MLRIELIGLSILVLLAIIPPALSLLALMDWAKVRLAHTRRRWWILRFAIITDLILALCLVDGFLIEPKMLTVTRLSATSPKIASHTASLKIVHIADIHFERKTRLTEKVLKTVAHESPDLIIVTGDVHQLGKYDKSRFGDFLSRLCSIAPTYGITGFDDELTLKQASGQFCVMNTSWDDITIRGTTVHLQGLHATKGIPDIGAFHIVLMHSPDGILSAAGRHADWCFAGHTHGGQVRLPFWGAITTAAATGKRYEYGRYKVGKMNVFVSRGIGLEPRPAPQVRFLCPPEIVVLTLKGSGT